MRSAFAAVGAVVTAAFIAGWGSRLRGYDEPAYRWLQWWAPRAHHVTVRVVTATHMAVGAIASVVAMSFGWYPWGQSLWWLNALVYAAAGEAVFRSDWSDFFLDTATPTGSLLHVLLKERQARLRDMVTQRNVPIFLSKLTDEQLLHLVTTLIEERFKDADQVALASKHHLLTSLRVAGAALEGKLTDEEGGGALLSIQGGAIGRERRDAIVWLRHTAVREIRAVEYRLPGFDNVDDALRSIGADLASGPELFR
ncbi:MAG: hypothetical protein ACRD0K_28795 [Egibacteraceae bacterium]